MLEGVIDNDEGFLYTKATNHKGALISLIRPSVKACAVMYVLLSVSFGHATWVLYVRSHNEAGEIKFLVDQKG